MDLRFNKGTRVCCFTLWLVGSISIQVAADDFSWNAGLDPQDAKQLVVALSVNRASGAIRLPRTYFVVYFYGEGNTPLGYDILPLGARILKPGLHRFVFPNKFTLAKKVDPKEAIPEGRGLDFNLLQEDDEKIQSTSAEEIDCATKTKSKNQSLDYQRELDQMECERKKKILSLCRWHYTPEKIKRCLDKAWGQEREPNLPDLDPTCQQGLFGALLVEKSGVIVVATATAATGKNMSSNQVEFRTVEVLKGTAVPQEFRVDGFLTESDDFNSSSSIPYGTGRNAGLNCFTKNYRQDATYLMLLDTREGMSPYWSPLSPTNEQLHPESDPWLNWVRDALAKGGK